MTLRPLHRSGGKLARGTFVVCALAVVVLVVAVPSALAADQVKLTVKGTSFAGTEKNTGSTTHNFISIGTSGQESNPITSFTVNGQQCQLYAAYGSAYCSVNLPPGATATFSGTIQTSTTSFTFCTSDNSGINNDCNNVSAGTGPTPCPISQALLDLDVELGRTIHGASAGTLRGAALGGAIHRLEQEKLALIKGNVTGKVFGITGYSAVTQLAVIDYLFGGAQVGASSGNVQLAVEDLKKARTIKKALEKLINDHGSPEAGLTGDLDRLDENLTRTIHGASAGTLRGVALGGAIHRLEQEKLALIKGNVTGKVFGITGYSAVTQLAVIDYLFGGAQVGASSGNVQLAVEDLKKARTIKKTLEKLINDHGCA